MLQTLRSVEPAFDEWYAPWVQQMGGDPLLRYFYKLRSEILKEGGPQTSSGGHIEHLSSQDFQPFLDNPPPGAVGFFKLDRLGGSGFDIQMPDGSHMSYYVQLPATAQMQHWFKFQDPPTVHLGQPLTNTTVQNLSSLYIAYLTRLVDLADAAFGGTN